MDIKKILLSAATITGILTAGTIAANADTVTVKAGDTVSHIASANNTTVSAIEKANSLSNVDLIFVGQQIEVGGSSSNTTQASSSTVTPQAPAAKSQQAQSSSVNTQKQTSAASSQQTQKSQAQTSAASSQQTQSSQAQTSAASSQQAQSSQVQTSAASSQQTSQSSQSQTAQQTSTTSSTTTSSSSEEAAKNWIGSHESGNNYSATNGQYIGKYQLSKSYLNGDYSAANQERVAAQYVQSRYGTWANAQKHWEENGWY
ncbi:extracellular protein [Liquorilactobacillus aquaticus DSM 21051]|uniref:Extracellular protein n=1 Tax=Liquorilactobacillus aquaticus DSM 21051 TaxID=1423725 RepID=A0A0R2D5W1_9LACO|nr:LysM domain-containing protein [Liquorilactobacillus aquaticus]KRM95283.1 extracellular protein [Liquorilactobacillus aquaticus DSM 21051]